MNQSILIAGGSGLIGQAIQKEAESSGWNVTLLSRNPGNNTIQWDPGKGTIDLPSKMHFDAIINLTGESLSKSRWTKKQKEEIYSSRIKSARTLENYLFDGRLQTPVYVGASALGIYGDSGQKRVTESSAIKAKDWFSKTVVDWETSHKRIETLEIRTVIIRIGIVLSMEGGALKELLKTSPFGFVVYFGNGGQIWSWIHIQDLASVFMYVINTEKIKGTLNGTAPEPVSNKTLIKAISDQLPSPRLTLPVPKLVMRGMLGEMHRVLFDSCNAYPEKLIKSGYKFHFPTIGDASADLSRPGKTN